MNPRLVDQVWHRANGRCEYCGMPFPDYGLPFQIDHIVARQHGGSSDLANLALSCLHCNRHKGPNIAGRDHPREDSWREHFQLDGAVLVGITGIGRVTVQVLAMNEPEFLAAREALIREGAYTPPARKFLIPPICASSSDLPDNWTGTYKPMPRKRRELVSAQQSSCWTGCHSEQLWETSDLVPDVRPDGGSCTDRGFHPENNAPTLQPVLDAMAARPALAVRGRTMCLLLVTPGARCRVIRASMVLTPL